MIALKKTAGLEKMNLLRLLTILISRSCNVVIFGQISPQAGLGARVSSTIAARPLMRLLTNNHFLPALAEEGFQVGEIVDHRIICKEACK